MLLILGIVGFYSARFLYPIRGPSEELHVPTGFGLLPRCITARLPEHHYLTMSSLRTGTTEPTLYPDIVHCEGGRSAGSDLFNQAHMTISQYARLHATTIYGFRIMVFNAQSYQPEQQEPTTCLRAFRGFCFCSSQWG